MSSNYDAIAAFIETTLLSVSGIGKVFRAEPDIRSEKMIFDRLTQDSIRHYWVIERPDFESEQFDVEGTEKRVHNFQVHGIRAFDDDPTFASTSSKPWN